MRDDLNRFLVRGRYCFVLAAAMLQLSVAQAGELLGQFDVKSDLYLPQFDSKTDVDDIHSVAAIATLISDPRFSGVNYHAVAGAYGIQEGLYVPANELFELAFGEHWSDAHADRENALLEVAGIAVRTLQGGGGIWIAEAGQSDFSAALVRHLQNVVPGEDLKSRVHIVQHADWNEQVTTADDLEFVKEAVSYYKIPDGNAKGNGTPGFRSEAAVNWQSKINDARLSTLWTMAIGIADTYNGSDGRYLNEAVQKGGLDFSDVAESTWIFGFNDLVDTGDFFDEFAR